MQVKDNGLLCHQAVEQLNPLLKAEGSAPNAPGALQWLYTNGADMLEKPSMWIVVSCADVLVSCAHVLRAEGLTWSSAS